MMTTTTTPYHATRAILSHGDSLAREIVQLTYDHPGREDTAYQSRRDQIAAVALRYDRSEPVTAIDYTPAEHQVWSAVVENLKPLHQRYACKEYQIASRRLALDPRRLPQLEEVNRSLQAHGGFRMIPVMGFVSPRTFMRHLGEGMFLSTQYVRYPTTPLFSPEPDVIHELDGRRMKFGTFLLNRGSVDFDDPATVPIHVDSVPSALFPSIQAQLGAMVYCRVPDVGGELRVYDHPLVPRDAPIPPDLDHSWAYRALKPAAGDVILVNSRRPHAVIPGRDDERLANIMFLGSDGGYPLRIWT